MTKVACCQCCLTVICKVPIQCPNYPSCSQQVNTNWSSCSVSSNITQHITHNCHVSGLLLVFFLQFQQSKVKQRPCVSLLHHLSVTSQSSLTTEHIKLNFTLNTLVPRSVKFLRWSKLNHCPTEGCQKLYWIYHDHNDTGFLTWIFRSARYSQILVSIKWLCF